MKRDVYEIVVKSCSSCPLTHTDGIMCQLLEKMISNASAVMELCPLRTAQVTIRLHDEVS